MALLTISSIQQLKNFLDSIVLDKKLKIEVVDGETPFFTDEGVINLVSKIDELNRKKIVARISSDLWISRKTEIKKIISNK